MVFNCKKSVKGVSKENHKLLKDYVISGFIFKNNTFKNKVLFIFLEVIFKEILDLEKNNLILNLKINKKKIYSNYCNFLRELLYYKNAHLLKVILIDYKKSLKLNNSKIIEKLLLKNNFQFKIVFSLFCKDYLNCVVFETPEDWDLTQIPSSNLQLDNLFEWDGID